MRTMNWAHCVPGYLHPSGTMQTAGASHNWLKNTLCQVEIQQGAARDWDIVASDISTRILDRAREAIYREYPQQP